MNRLLRIGGGLALLATLAACATAPTGPSMLVLPGTGRTFDQFRVDDMECRHYAQLQSGGQAPQAISDDSTVRSAALGTAIGAVAGAAIGGSRGAGVGAGTGLLLGTASGTGAAQTSVQGAQRRYDNAYIQCMYAKGHRVPVYGQMSSDRAPYPSSPAQGRIPPPPPGNPPPPPPGVQLR